MLLLAGGALFAGCSGKPPALHPPEIDPQAASQNAMQLYDTSGDGQIDQSELKAAPELIATQEEIDADQNGNLTVQELSGFMQRQFIDAGAGAVRLKCVVLLDNQPLAGAQVTFEPAEFFDAGVLKTARGETDGFGAANISVAPDELPDTRAGVIPGLYVIRVSKLDHGKERVPEKYNVASELGGEVARRASYMPGALELRLSSR
jgi:hypothetical protein